MSFKTLEEANEYKLAQEQKYNDLLLSKQGLETKLQETETKNKEALTEINRLKIKNYEYYEKISVGTSTPPHAPNGDEDTEQKIKLEDVIKDI